MDAPGTYEELIRTIHDRFEAMSRSHRAIAVFLTQNPNEVGVLSLAAIAERCGIHASNLVRFAQALGFSGFRELQQLFRVRLTTAAPGFDTRVRALDAEFGPRKDQGEVAILRDLVVRDVASLQDLLGATRAEEMSRAVSLIEGAEMVYLIGQLRSAPVVELLRYLLTMLGKRTVLLDPSAGLATHMARAARPSDLLLAVSFRFYATEVVTVVEEAAARAVPIVAITDSTLSPLARSAQVVFAVPEHEHPFSRSLAAPMCLAQALAVGLAARLQGAERPRIPIVTTA